MKRKIKITKQQQQQLDAIKHSERREPIPRPAVFRTKKDYNRQAQKRAAAEQYKEVY